MTDEEKQFLEFMYFLEWLDSSGEVLAWHYPEESHEDTIHKYLKYQKEE